MRVAEIGCEGRRPRVLWGSSKCGNGDFVEMGEGSEGRRRRRRTSGMGKGNSRTIEKGFKRRKELSEKAKGGQLAGSKARDSPQSLLQMTFLFKPIPAQVVEKFSVL